MKKCFNCSNTGSIIHGFIICDSCKSNLRLFSDKTIMKYKSKKPKGFPKEIAQKLDFIEKDYIKKKIKLLHIQERIQKL